jgi:hypothetical protein
MFPLDCVEQCRRYPSGVDVAIGEGGLNCGLPKCDVDQYCMRTKCLVLVARHAADQDEVEFPQKLDALFKCRREFSFPFSMQYVLMKWLLLFPVWNSGSQQ